MEEATILSTCQPPPRRPIHATFTLPTWFLSPRYLNYTTGAPPFWPATGVPSPVGLLYFTRTCAWRGARALCGWTRNCALQWVQPPAVHAHCCTPAHMSAVLRHNSCSQHDNSHSHSLSHTHLTRARDSLTTRAHSPMHIDSSPSRQQRPLAY